MKVEVENHSKIDKFFTVTTKHLNLEVDYDDVDHAEVDAAVQQLKEIISIHWNPDRHNDLLVIELMKEWKADKSIRDDYKGICEFLNDRGVK